MNVENTAPLDRIFHPHTKFLPKVTILENGTGPSSTRAPPSRSPSGRTSRPISSACPKNPARAAAAEVLRKLRSPLRPPPPSKKRIPRPPRSRHGCQMAIAGFTAMIQAFLSLYCLVKNTLPPKVFFKFFKEQNLFFFHKFDGF